MDEILKDDLQNEIERERIQEEYKNDCLLKAIKEIKEMVLWVEDSTLEDVKGIIRELENEIGEI